MNLVVGSFPPSDTLFPYLRNFFVQAIHQKEFAHHDIALNCVTKLERTAVNGARQYPPIALEYDSIVVRFHPCFIFSPSVDGSSNQINTHRPKDQSLSKSTSLTFPQGASIWTRP